MGTNSTDTKPKSFCGRKVFDKYVLGVKTQEFFVLLNLIMLKNVYWHWVCYDSARTSRRFTQKITCSITTKVCGNDKDGYDWQVGAVKNKVFDKNALRQLNTKTF